MSTLREQLGLADFDDDVLIDELVQRVAATDPFIKINSRDAVCVLCGRKNGHDFCPWVIAQALLERVGDKAKGGPR